MTTSLAKIYSKSTRLTIRVLFLVLWMMTIVQPVKAQSLTLSILPVNTTITLNGTNTATLQVVVANVLDLMGFDITFTYDPAIVQLSKWEHGGFLNIASLQQYRNINNPGYLRLAFSQIAVPAVNGNGTLLKLTFSGKAFGTSLVTIVNAAFGKPSGATFYPALFHGQLTTTFDPTSVTNSAVTGTVSLQGQSTSAGIRLKLDNGLYVNRGPYAGTSLNQSGTNLSISPVVMDLYTVTTAQPRYINIDSACGKTKAVFGATTTLNPLKLKGGNAVWTDNEINMQDITAITGVYGEPSTLEAPLDADINANGWVDVFDLAMAAANYGLNCATAYADWTP